MNKHLKTLVFVIVALFLIGVTYNITSYFKDKSVDDLKRTLKTYKIKNDSLKEIEDGLYTKLVADTLTKKQLKNKITDLELKVKNPKIVIKKEFIFDTIEKPIDNIVKTDSLIKIEDYYPNKKDYFVKYEAELRDYEDKGKFTLKPLNLSLGIGQNKDGTYSLNTKVPSFISVNSIDVQSLPAENTKVDNFGFLVGVGYGKDFRTDGEYLNAQIGVRIKRTYFTINAGTNETINGTLTFELK